MFTTGDVVGEEEDEEEDGEEVEGVSATVDWTPSSLCMFTLPSQPADIIVLPVRFVSKDRGYSSRNRESKRETARERARRRERHTSTINECRNFAVMAMKRSQKLTIVVIMNLQKKSYK